jgi:uncharacterized Zn finger protein
MGYSREDRFEWPRYVSVAEKKQEVAKRIQSMQKKGKPLNPVVVEGRLIAKTFWGKAWCDNLEAYSDFASRLPRGRTYVRNGFVIDMQMTKGQANAQVMGSDLYKVVIEVKPISEDHWQALVKACAGKIDSLIELLQGNFSKAVMEILTQKQNGLFPKPQEIKMRCSCPDHARMCKHIAAVLYGIGAALDTKPEWLFVLRHVDHVDLISSASQGSAFMQSQTSENVLEDGELSALFGIEIDAGTDKPVAAKKTAPKAKAKAKVKKPVEENPIKAKAVVKKSKKIS